MASVNQDHANDAIATAKDVSLQNTLNGDVLAYDSGLQKWKNKSVSLAPVVVVWSSSTGWGGS